MANGDLTYRTATTEDGTTVYSWYVGDQAVDYHGNPVTLKDTPQGEKWYTKEQMQELGGVGKDKIDLATALSGKSPSVKKSDSKEPMAEPRYLRFMDKVGNRVEAAVRRALGVPPGTTPSQYFIKVLALAQSIIFPQFDSLSPEQQDSKLEEWDKNELELFNSQVLIATSQIGAEQTRTALAFAHESYREIFIAPLELQLSLTSLPHERLRIQRAINMLTAQGTAFADGFEDWVADQARVDDGGLPELPFFGPESNSTLLSWLGEYIAEQTPLHINGTVITTDGILSGETLEAYSNSARTAALGHASNLALRVRILKEFEAEHARVVGQINQITSTDRQNMVGPDASLALANARVKISLDYEGWATEYLAIPPDKREGLITFFRSKAYGVISDAVSDVPELYALTLDMETSNRSGLLLQKIGKDTDFRADLESVKLAHKTSSNFDIARASDYLRDGLSLEQSLANARAWRKLETAATSARLEKTALTRLVEQYGLLSPTEMMDIYVSDPTHAKREYVKDPVTGRYGQKTDTTPAGTGRLFSPGVIERATALGIDPDEVQNRLDDDSVQFTLSEAIADVQRLDAERAKVESKREAWIRDWRTWLSNQTGLGQDNLTEADFLRLTGYTLHTLSQQVVGGGATSLEGVTEAKWSDAHAAKLKLDTQAKITAAVTMTTSVQAQNEEFNGMSLDQVHRARYYLTEDNMSAAAAAEKVRKEDRFFDEKGATPAERHSTIDFMRRFGDDQATALTRVRASGQARMTEVENVDDFRETVLQSLTARGITEQDLSELTGLTIADMIQQSTKVDADGKPKFDKAKANKLWIKVDRQLAANLNVTNAEAVFDSRGLTEDQKADARLYMARQKELGAPVTANAAANKMIEDSKKLRDSGVSEDYPGRYAIETPVGIREGLVRDREAFAATLPGYGVAAVEPGSALESYIKGAPGAVDYGFTKETALSYIRQHEGFKDRIANAADPDAEAAAIYDQIASGRTEQAPSGKYETIAPFNFESGDSPGGTGQAFANRVKGVLDREKFGTEYEQDMYGRLAARLGLTMAEFKTQREAGFTEEQNQIMKQHSIEESGREERAKSPPPGSPGTQTGGKVTGLPDIDFFH